MARGAKTSGARMKIDVLFFLAETWLLFPKLFPNNRRRPRGEREGGGEGVIEGGGEG